MSLTIQNQILWGAERLNQCYFGPRVTRLSDDGDHLAMVTQEISGSDYLGPVLYSHSYDRGQSWSEPTAIIGSEKRSTHDGIDEAVVDMSIEYHAPSGMLLGIGVNIYYQDGRKLDAHRLSCAENAGCDDFSRPMLPVYCCLNQYGEALSSLNPVDVASLIDCSQCSILSCGGAQKLWVDDHSLLMPVSIGQFGKLSRSATTIRCAFDDSRLVAVAMGDCVEVSTGRGFIEPSIAYYANRYVMTMRAEDGCGYVATSKDGLAWEGLKPWRWNQTQDCIETGSTQQHWIEIAGKLYLVYTRKDACNASVFRWRAPVYICEVSDQMELIRDTEQVVFPMAGDPVLDPKRVPRMGNFWPATIDCNEAVVTVGEVRPDNNWHGNTLLARIKG